MRGIWRAGSAPGESKTCRRGGKLATCCRLRYPGRRAVSHDGEFCSFDAFLKIYDIRDQALDALAVIVRGADTDRLELAPQSAGLLAVTLGLSANCADDDHLMLERSMPIYDALYAWCRSLRGETHGWNPNLGR